MSFNFGEGLGMGDDNLSHMKSHQGVIPADSAKIVQKQESGKNVIVIDTGTPLSKSMVEKVKKVISSTQQKPVGEEASKQAQIEEFLKKYKTFNDVPVKDMRHIIPLLLMEVYVEKYGHYTKKVKGLWEKRPEDWPVHIPFVDPNNRLKNEGEKNVKPKKELLGHMLTYLMERYTTMKKAAETSDGYLLHASDPLLYCPDQSDVQNDDFSHYVVNLKEMSESELRVAEQSVSNQSLTSEQISGYSSAASGYQFVFLPGIQSSLSSVPTGGSLLQSSFSAVEDPLSGGVNEEHGELVKDGPGSCFEMQWTNQMQPEGDVRPPEQVVDNEEDPFCTKDWKPFDEIRERTRSKLHYLRGKALVPQVMLAQLESVHGLLVKLCVAELESSATMKLLEKWYKLEMCIDGVKFQLSDLYIYTDTIQGLHDELKLKAVPELPVMDFMGKANLKSKENTAVSDDQRMDLPIPAEDPQQFNSLLNIRPRRDPAGGMVLFPSGDQLKLRGLELNGCGVSMLSDNCKPVQPAQEDGAAQTLDNSFFSDELIDFNDDFLTEILSSLNLPQLSMPVQESAPASQHTSQLVGKLEMPVDVLQRVITSVSVPLCGGGNLMPLMSLPLPAVSSAPSRLISASSVGSPSTAVAEECINRLSLVSVDPTPPPLLNPSPALPTQPPLEHLLSRPRAGGRRGGKRCYDKDDEMDEMVPGPSLHATAYNMTIPLMVEEISNSLDKPISRPLKKKSRQTLDE